MSGLWARTLLLLCFWQPVADAQDSPAPFLSPQDVAASFRYDGNLELRDVTQSSRSSNRGVIWSGYFAARDNTFVPTTITMASGGSILTPQLLRQLDAMVRLDPTVAQRAAAPPLAQSITLSNGAKGFVFQSGLGPGGFGYSAIATTADGAFDVAVSLNFPSSAPIQKTGRTGPYYEAIMNKGAAGIPSTLEEVIARVFAFAERRLRDTKIVANQNAAAASLSGSPSSTLADATGTANPIISATPTSSPEKSESGSANVGLWVFTAAAVIAAIVGALFIYGKKRRARSRNE